jgi:hypothetical protein
MQSLPLKLLPNATTKLYRDWALIFVAHLVSDIRNHSTHVYTDFRSTVKRN